MYQSYLSCSFSQLSHSNNGCTILHGLSVLQSELEVLCKDILKLYSFSTNITINFFFVVTFCLFHMEALVLCLHFDFI